MIVYIYGLQDPRNDELRYVGATINLKERYEGHLRDRKRTHKTNWIKSLKRGNFKPEIFVIEEVEENEWEESERFWIAYFRYIGADLTNMTDGGEKPSMTKEQREELSTKLRVQFAGENNPFFGKHHSEESVRKNRHSHLGKKLKPESVAKRQQTIKERGSNLGKRGELSPNWGSKRTKEQIERMSEAQKIAQGKRIGIKHTEEHNRKISEGNKGRVVLDETRDKIRKSNTGKSQSEETREKLRQINLGKEMPQKTKDKISAALAGKPKSPEHIAKLSGENHPNFGKPMSIEQRAKISASQIGRVQSEETRKKISVAISGENNPFFGKTHSDETKAKIGKAAKGRTHRGHKYTDEERTAISERMSGENHPFWGKFGADHPAFGKKNSEETREKKRAARLAYIEKQRVEREGTQPTLFT